MSEELKQDCLDKATLHDGSYKIKILADSVLHVGSLIGVGMVFGDVNNKVRSSKTSFVIAMSSLFAQGLHLYFHYNKVIIKNYEAKIMYTKLSQEIYPNYNVYDELYWEIRSNKIIEKKKEYDSSYPTPFTFMKWFSVKI